MFKAELTSLEVEQVSVPSEHFFFIILLSLVVIWCWKMIELFLGLFDLISLLLPGVVVEQRNRLNTIIYKPRWKTTARNREKIKYNVN